METKSKKSNFLKEHKMSIFVIVSAVVMLIGLSYAWLQLTLKGTKELTLTAGNLSLELDDSMAGGIAMSDAIPVSDEEGLSQQGYTFTLENKGKVVSDYTIYLDDLNLTEGQTRMPDSAIKYQLTKDGEEIGFDLLSTAGENPNRILDNGTISNGEKYTYILKIWIDSNAGNEVMGTVLKGQLRIETMQSAKISSKGSITKLLKKKNTTTPSQYEEQYEKQKKEMFTFTHVAGSQQSGWTTEELTDYRYTGTNPNNYVTFNNEVWRMIGIFTVEDDTGKKEQRIKIIRDQPIGNYSWDNTGSEGVNDWSKSALQKVLNSGAYYNRTSGICPSGQNGATIACDFSNTGLTVDAKNMIGKTKWYLGGINDAYRGTLSSNLTPSQYYEYERGNTVYSGRETYWIGEVGLMYPSDYGYAASGSNCLNTALVSYNSSCMNTDWLFNSKHQWTISPYFGNSNDVFLIHLSGRDTTSYVYDHLYISPSVYLKSSVSISSGDGSKENPYTLKIN